MIGKVSAVVLGGLLVAAAVAAPDALARRGGGPGGGRGGYGSCRQEARCGCTQDGARQQRRQREAPCPQDPSQCPNGGDCPRQGQAPGPQDGSQDGTGKGAGRN